MLRHWDFIDKTGTKPLNRPLRCVVIRRAGDDYGIVDCPDERRNGTASFERITVPTKLFLNFETDMPGTNLHMLGIAHAKIEVTNI